MEAGSPPALASAWSIARIAALRSAALPVSAALRRAASSTPVASKAPLAGS
jgi:hypothetical protein